MRFFAIILCLFPLFELHAHSVDLKHLPLGDGKLSSSPQRDWIWPCHIDPQGGGANVKGAWIHSDGTYDYTAKAVVDGKVNWPRKFKMNIEGSKRIFTSNDFPDHPTGVFPVAKNDDAYLVDQNPNSIQEQDMRVELPLEPNLAAQAQCTPGAVGILLSGAVLFNALDAPGRDAVAHETQDGCQGHPQNSGVYHYHNLTSCIPDKTDSTGHSALVGYALDGFGIYGHKGEGGKELTNADLDECHGHTHVIDWNGKKIPMYHYHATWEFPYTIGCMRGSFDRENVRKISGTRGGGGDRPNSERRPEHNEERGPPDGGRHPNLSVAAQKLGISEEKLREALGPPPPDLQESARTLGIPFEKLKEALDSSR